jgi:replicative superfamily II helicase
MKRILKDKNYPKGICVYVAPTKALVNQVSGKNKLDFS